MIKAELTKCNFSDTLWILDMKREIILYETESGARPVAKFFRKLDRETYKRILAGLKHIEAGTASAHLFQKMVHTDDLWELRIAYSKNIYRLLCFFDGAALVVVASGFQKKTQKTPRQAIKTAEARKLDYFRRQNND